MAKSAIVRGLVGTLLVIGAAGAVAGSSGPPTVGPCQRAYLTIPTPSGGDYQVLDAINTTGVLQFPDVYLTVSEAADGTITVFATRDDAALMQAIAVPVRYRHAAHSYGDLEALTMRIAGDTPTLARSGITLAQWGPDVTADNVSVTLLTPVDCTGSIILPPATVTRAQHIFDAAYGRGLIVLAPYSMPAAIAL